MNRTACALFFVASGLAAPKLPFDVQALLKINRISEAALSPDGSTVAFTVQTVDIAQNTKPQQIYVVPAQGGAPRQITHDGVNNESPRWSPDSHHIAYLSNRSGSMQIWLMNSDGGEARQITNISTEAGNPQIAPDGKKVLFTSDVYPDCPNDACNRVRLEAEKNGKVKARSYTSLLFRHWTEWQSARRSHLFVAPIGGGAAKDLTPGPSEVPPFSLSGSGDYAVSPDSTEVCYTMNSDPVPAVSTNADLFVVSIEGGEPKQVTTNPGADLDPHYSPDGKMLAYRSQARAGYESDRWRLMALERASGKLTSVTEALDRSIDSFAWSPDSSRIFFTAEDRGRRAIQMIAASGGATRVIVNGASSMDDVQLSADSKMMIFVQQSGSAPVEIYRAASSGGPPVALTHLNDELLAPYALTPLEEFWVDAPDKAHIHSFLVKPPGFVESQKYPVLFLIHGGPEGEWGEEWTYRWNAQVFASAGYLVVMPNPRGSFGYGQKFTEEINSDWGGKAYEDVMAVADHVAALPYADADRMGAAGGSYGGYMVDWILGHTTRFKALVSHAGVFDLRSMAGATEELWFPLWEFQGMPWDNPDVYAKWSPSYFVKDFHTPTLVIHGELDFRVPYTQGLQLYTALQMEKVPSKLLVYPDEGHWILKPQNSVLWYNTFLEWMGEWVKNGRGAGAARP